MNPTKAEKTYWDRLASVVGCIVCRNDGHENHMVSIHHISGRTQPGAHSNVIPLCAAHHQTGGEGVALHPYTRRWEQNYGSQSDLKKQCDEILGTNNGQE